MGGQSIFIQEPGQKSWGDGKGKFFGWEAEGVKKLEILLQICKKSRKVQKNFLKNVIFWPKKSKFSSKRHFFPKLMYEYI